MADFSEFAKDLENRLMESAKREAGDIPPPIPIDIPDIEISTVSIESTLNEITVLSNACYKSLKLNPSNQIILAKTISLLEIKCRMMGVYNVKPDVQELIDNEINTYKRRFIKLATDIFKSKDMNNLVNKLAEEGL